MTSPETLAVIGAGLAGAKAVEAARERGFDGRIVLIGEESGAPYERPPLSKAILRGEKDIASAQVHDEGFYRDHDVELVNDRVTEIDVPAKRITFSGGDAVGVTTLILATGASPRRLGMPGGKLAGIHYLRTIDDAVRLRDAIRSATRVAVIGAGWIGSEAAASAKQMGADVVLIDPAPVPLQRVLGDEVGVVFRRLHEAHGVEMRLGTGVRELRGTTNVEAVVLADGRVEPADVVIAGIGVVPRTELARAAGLTVDNGIVVDEHLQASARGVYAAGDVANAHHPHYGRRIRVEHWANAIDQGTTAGRNATGECEAYTKLPYFFSDQYDLGMEYVGYGDAADRVTVRGDTDAREFIAFWHRDRVVTAAMNVNVWDVAADLRALVTSRRTVDPQRLADPDVPLAEL